MTTETTVKESWRADKQGRRYAVDQFAVFVLSENPYGHVAEVYGKTFGEADARARLLAASRDLLESTKSLLDILNRIAPGDGVVRVLARAAIFKATGEQP